LRLATNGTFLAAQPGDALASYRTQCEAFVDAFRIEDRIDHNGLLPIVCDLQLRVQLPLLRHGSGSTPGRLAVSQPSLELNHKARHKPWSGANGQRRLGVLHPPFTSSADSAC